MPSEPLTSVPLSAERVRSRLRTQAITPKVRRVDRLVTGIVGVVVLLAGLTLVEWRFGWLDAALGSWPRRVDLRPALDLTTTWWWPWAEAVVGVLLALIGLRWLLAHAPRPVGTQQSTVSDDVHGRSSVDLTSVAVACADRFGSLTPVLSSSGTARRTRGQYVVELRCAVDEIGARGDLVAAATDQVARDLDSAFGPDMVRLRVLLGAPTLARLGRSSSDSVAQVEDS